MCYPPPQAMWYEVAAGRAYLAAKQYGKVCAPLGQPRRRTAGASTHHSLLLLQAASPFPSLQPTPTCCRPCLPCCPSQALKRFLKVQQHFEDFQEDQFDFHGYCIRKMVSAGE